MTDARRVAVDALHRVEHDGAYANLVVPAVLARSALDSRDRAFVTDLVYGTTRMRRACDFAVDRFIVKEPAPEVRTVLRLGAYQLLFGGVPPHAAVSATVGLAPARARGFVNAILRRVAAAPVEWPDLATRLSYPDWIVARMIAELGEADAIGALERMNEAPPVTRRPDGYVQDRASQWVAELVEACAGERVADVGAAPGGKATAMAESGAFVVGLELRPGRAGLVVANAERLGLDGSRLAVVAGDGTQPPLRTAAFDRVLVDAPCSNLGALRRRPDARWRIEPHDVDRLVAVQGALLTAARRLVRPGGVVVYSVCTLTAAESIEHDDGGWPTLDRPSAPWRPCGSGARILPQDADTDGMTVLRYRRPT
jgi:16S rRNA (cytosine967-C5)-methyltransferase